MMHCAKFGRSDLADLKKKKWNVYDDKNSDKFDYNILDMTVAFQF